MPTKRQNKSARTETRPTGLRRKRRPVRKQQEKKQNALRPNTPDSNGLTIAATNLQELPPVAASSIGINIDEQPQWTQQEFLVHQTEQEVFIQFEAECRVGRLLTPDEICELARRIYEELLHEELKHPDYADEEMSLSAEFNATEEWFQDFCKRYSIPWRPHEEIVGTATENTATQLLPTAKPNEIVIINLTEDDDGDDDSVVEVPLEKELMEPQQIVENVNQTTNIIQIDDDTPTVSKKAKNEAASGVNSKANIIPAVDERQPVIEKKSNKQANQNDVKNESNNISPISAECKQSVKKFVRNFHRIVKAGDYSPSQVFNAAQMIFKWKLLPHCTVKRKRNALAENDDRVSLLFCGNASGEFLVKPMFLHHTYVPVGEDETLLPIYVPKTSSATRANYNRAEHFLAWLQDCFIPEVRDFLEVMDLPAKALLLMDPGLLQGHTKLPLNAEHNFVEFLYFPTDVTNLVQPLSMTVMPTFACNYLQRLFQTILSLLAETSANGRSLMSLWSEYPLSKALPLMQKSIEEINVSCWNSGWATFWPEIVNNAFDPQLITSAMERIAATGRRIRKVGFIKISKSEVEQHLRRNEFLRPAFLSFDGHAIAINELNSDNDSHIEDVSHDVLDKNSQHKEVKECEEEIADEKRTDDSDDDEDDHHIDGFEESKSKKVKTNTKKEMTFKSGLKAVKTPPVSHRGSLSEDDIPTSEEYNLSDCHSELSLPTFSDCSLGEELDDDQSSVASATSLKLASVKKSKNRLVNKIDRLGHRQTPINSPSVKEIREARSSQFVNIERKLCKVIPIRSEQPVTSMLPKLFETVREFINFQDDLDKNLNLQKRVLNYFRSQILENDPSYDKTIQRIWRGVLSDRAAFEFVWKGRRYNQRMPVVNFKFTTLLRLFFLRRLKMSEIDFDTTCSRYFEAAHDRQRRRLRKIEREKEKRDTEA